MKKIYALMFLFLATMAWATQEPMSKSNPVAIASDQSAIFVVFGQPTITQTFTLTATNTYTPTGSPTLTYTRTPVYTATPTLSLTPSYTPTNTIPAGTKTMTPLNTNTFTPTYTNTPSYTPTATYTPTGSATKTYTPTPSYTPTPTVNLTTVPATTTPGAFNVNPLFNSASGASDPWYDAAPQGTPTKGTGNVYDNLNSNAWSNVYGPAVLSSPTPTFTGTLTPSITPTPQNIYIAMTNTPTTNLTATPTSTATPTPPLSWSAPQTYNVVLTPGIYGGGNLSFTIPRTSSQIEVLCTNLGIVGANAVSIYEMPAMPFSTPNVNSALSQVVPLAVGVPMFFYPAVPNTRNYIGGSTNNFGFVIIPTATIPVSVTFTFQVIYSLTSSLPTKYQYLFERGYDVAHGFRIYWESYATEGQKIYMKPRFVRSMS